MLFRSLFAITLLFPVAAALSCDECSTNYVHTGTQATAAADCSSLKTYLNCLETATGAGCPPIQDRATAVTNNYESIKTSCTLTDSCMCQKNFWGTFLDTANQADCTAAKDRIDCLRQSNEAGCNSETITQLVGYTETFLGSTSCTAISGTACGCEAEYTKAAKTTPAETCTANKDLIACLKTLKGNACKGSVTALATLAETAIKDTADCAVTGSACECEIIYAKANKSTDGKFCTATKSFMSCLHSKAGAGCAGGTTRDQVLDAAVSTAINIPNDACPISNTRCECENTYAKADKGDNPKNCQESKALVVCLKDKSGTGCDESKSVSDLVSAVEKTIITTLGESNCPVSATPCLCDIAYAKADISSADKKCIADLAKASCLVGKKGNTCDGTAASAVATSVETAVASCAGKTDTCDCELAFAKADISDAAKECAQIRKLAGCIRDKTKKGCNVERSVIGTFVNGRFEALGTSCATTPTCNCVKDFLKADISEEKTQCENKNKYIDCLAAVTSTNKDAEVSCDGTTTHKTLSDGLTKATCSAGSSVAFTWLLMTLALAVRGYLL